MKPVKDGLCLRLFLNTSDDFKFFHNAATNQLLSATWQEGMPDDELDEAEGSADE